MNTKAVFLKPLYLLLLGIIIVITQACIPYYTTKVIFDPERKDKADTLKTSVNEKFIETNFKPIWFKDLQNNKFIQDGRIDYTRSKNKHTTPDGMGVFLLFTLIGGPIYRVSGFDLLELNTNISFKLEKTCGQILGLFFYGSLMSIGTCIGIIGDEQLYETAFAGVLTEVYPYLTLSERELLYKNHKLFVVHEHFSEDVSKYILTLNNKQQDKIVNQFTEREKEYVTLKNDPINEALSGKAIYSKNKIPQISRYVLDFRPDNYSPGNASMEAVNDYVQGMIDNYLSLKDIEIPPVIPEPALPSQTIRQNDWETDDEFEQRIIGINEKRRQQIAGIQEGYRKKVEERNQKILKLEKISLQRKNELPKIQKIFIRDALTVVFGGFKPSSPKLDKKNGDVHLDIVGLENSNFKLTAVAPSKGDLTFRKQIIGNLPQADYQTILNIGDDGSISLNEINLNTADSSAVAKPSAEGLKNSDSMMITLNLDDEGGLSRIGNIQKQNPNLVDRKEVSSIVYRDGRAAELNYNDDIPNLLKNLKPVAETGNKWIFAVGAEKYEHTDNINFARRSAELYVESIQKLFGVRPGQTFALYDEKATSGNIKTSLKKMLEGVSKGDTIYFYYNGHGIPVQKEDNEPYILPVDMIPDYVSDEKELKLKEVYKKFSDSKADKIIAVIDSCFTGKADGKSVFKGGKAATRLRPRNVTFDKNKMTVITAGTDKEYSNALPDKGHRLLSYYVIKSLLNGRKDIDSFYKEVSLNVKDASKKLGPEAWQNPQIYGNINLEF